MTASKKDRLDAAWKLLKETEALARKLYLETETSAWKLCGETVDSAWKLYMGTKAKIEAEP